MQAAHKEHLIVSCFGIMLTSFWNGLRWTWWLVIWKHLVYYWPFVKWVDRWRHKELKMQSSSSSFGLSFKSFWINGRIVRDLTCLNAPVTSLSRYINIPLRNDNQYKKLVVKVPRITFPHIISYGTNEYGSWNWKKIVAKGLNATSQNATDCSLYVIWHIL